MFEFYMKIVNGLVAITDHYNGIHHWIYRVFFRGVEPIEDFYLTDLNVGLWLVTAFSIAICFAMLFIPLKNASITQRPVRRRIKMLMPLGIILSPLPLILMFLYELFLGVRGIYYLIKRIIFEIKAEIKYKKSHK